MCDSASLREDTGSSEGRAARIIEHPTHRQEVLIQLHVPIVATRSVAALGPRSWLTPRSSVISTASRRRRTERVRPTSNQGTHPLRGAHRDPGVMRNLRKRDAAGRTTRRQRSAGLGDFQQISDQIVPGQQHAAGLTRANYRSGWAGIQRGTHDNLHQRPEPAYEGTLPETCQISINELIII
jgi:hypothetical protein